MLTESSIIRTDIYMIIEELQEKLDKIEGSRWLISGGAGFIGGYFLDLIHYCNKYLFRKPCHVQCIENFLSGTPLRIQHLAGDKYIKVMEADIRKPLSLTGSYDFIVHAASIASPVFYRKHPLQTIETNVTGLKNLLDLHVGRDIKGFLFFSSSEIYGDPLPQFIPTPEHYNGNVSCTGPRACYDESKRLGETLAVNYYREYQLPVKIVRPFNVYGPGLRLDDKRVIPDFFRDVLYRKKITILSNGMPTRSFCYIRDAFTGFLLALLSDYHGEAFNIGNDEQEIAMNALAEKITDLVGGAEIEYRISCEADYLTDNPQRRCPDLTKARKLLNYHPKVNLEVGLSRTLEWYREVYNNESEIPLS